MVGEAPAKLPTNFVEAIGLSPEQAARFELFLFAPGSISDANVTGYQTRLVDTGLSLEQTRRVGFKISKTQIRYYNAGDAALAQSLASELDIVARDFTANGGDGGRIEIWMQGDAGASAPARTTQRTTTTRRTTRPTVDTRTRLTNSIIQQLQSN